MEKTSPNSMLLFPCPGCNAQLHFEPGAQEMTCSYCGTNVPVAGANSPLTSYDLQSHLTPEGVATEAIEQKVYKCTRCGAEKIYTTELPSFICDFCDFEVVNPIAFKTRSIQPSSIIPFQVNEAQALDILRDWLNNDIVSGSATVPKEVASLNTEINLRGLYLPFWTISVTTDSQWSGEAGSYYFETREEKDKDGNKVIYREQKTEWSKRSGTHQKKFKNVLKQGSTQTTIWMDAVSPYELKELVNFNESYISGFDTQVYDIPLTSVYKEVADDMRRSINDSCSFHCKKDTHRNLIINTTYTSQTFKLILLPIWIGTVAYNGKNHDFRINGQTGKIAGKMPQEEINKWHVVIVLAIIFLILYLIAKYG